MVCCPPLSLPWVGQTLTLGLRAHERQLGWLPVRADNSKQLALFVGHDASDTLNFEDRPAIHMKTCARTRLVK